MTLATGERARSRGFTMVEVMVVLAIVTVLFSLVMVAAVKNRRTAAISATKALIEQLESGLQDYKALTGRFPPDGFDSDVVNDEGEQVNGSAALYYALSKEITVVKNVGGNRRLSRHEPVMSFKQDMLTLEDEDYPGVREIVDGFKTPIHYDNTEDEDFVAQDGTAHIPEVGGHPPDPRESTDYDAVGSEGIQNIGGYDIWSHGPGKHLETESLNEVIATWNLQN